MKDKFLKVLRFLKDWKRQAGCLRWMAARTKPFAWPLILMLALQTAGALMGVGGTVVGKNLIDSAASSGEGGRFTWLAAVTLGSIALIAASTMLTGVVSERYAFGIREKLFESILRANWRDVTSFHSGDLVTRLTSDIDCVAGGVTSLLPNIFLTLVRVFAAFGVLYHYDRMLALSALTLAPVGALFALLLGEAIKRHQAALKKNESEYRAFLQERITGLDVVKAFCREDDAKLHLQAFRDERVGLIRKKSVQSALLGFALQLVFSASYLLAFGWGIRGLSNGSITFGMMTAFIALVSQVQGPLLALSQMVPQFMNVLASAARILEVEDRASERRLTPQPFGGRVGFQAERVSFAYGREPVLSDVCVNIQPGDIVGFVGSSGAGKTTLVRLMLAFVEPQGAGRIMFYGENGAQEEASAASRRLIAYVPQGNMLVSGTIADNLRVGNKDATEQDMWNALDIADAQVFVRALPHGLDTMILEHAGGLSEGQAQRIAIARAILKDCPLLILDEATGALDEATESRVLSRLFQVGKARTCLMITHRKSVLRFCNRALTIANTKIIELPVERSTETI